MNADEIDKIIAESVAQSKGKSRWHRPQRRRHDVSSIRQLLNTLFLIGTVATFILWFATPNDHRLFFVVGFSSMLIKIIEILIRLFA